MNAATIDPQGNVSEDEMAKSIEAELMNNSSGLQETQGFKNLGDMREGGSDMTQEKPMLPKDGNKSEMFGNSNKVEALSNKIGAGMIANIFNRKTLYKSRNDIEYDDSGSECEEPEQAKVGGVSWGGFAKKLVSES